MVNKHKINLHCGSQNLLYFLRQKYWPVGGRNSTRKIIHNCVACFKAKTRPLLYIIGDLPDYRVEQCLPFYHCGIDFAGPFTSRD